jgi:L-ascorbate metabolism protein UlaG (beta-lactamase superfamily)
MLLRVLAVLLMMCSTAVAQTKDKLPSQCLAVAENLRNMGARIHYANLKLDEARISFIGHSTFLVESPQGIKLATDYNGRDLGLIPDVVTMNHAHGTHYTDFPDPAIKTVIRGWRDDGEPADIDETIGDMRIRNVTTDIRFGAGRRANANSIFVIETGTLCIAHLGHLHHELTPEQKGWVGRVDVLMVPVDGGYTMPVQNMMSVLKEFDARIMIPMHMFGPETKGAFLAEAARNFKVEYLSEPTMVVSPTSLPAQPTVMVMPGY